MQKFRRQIWLDFYFSSDIFWPIIYITLSVIFFYKELSAFSTQFSTFMFPYFSILFLVFHQLFHGSAHTFPQQSSHSYINIINFTRFPPILTPLCVPTSANGVSAIALLLVKKRRPPQRSPLSLGNISGRVGVQIHPGRMARQILIIALRTDHGAVIPAQ